MTPNFSPNPIDNFKLTRWWRLATNDILFLEPRQITPNWNNIRALWTVSAIKVSHSKVNRLCSARRKNLRCPWINWSNPIPTNRKPHGRRFFQNTHLIADSFKFSFFLFARVLRIRKFSRVSFLSKSRFVSPRNNPAVERNCIFQTYNTHFPAAKSTKNCKIFPFVEAPLIRFFRMRFFFSDLHSFKVKTTL